jgi:hypothetical protein
MVGLGTMVCCAGVSFGLTLKNPIFFPRFFGFAFLLGPVDFFTLCDLKSRSPQKNASPNEDFHESAGCTQCKKKTAASFVSQKGNKKIKKMSGGKITKGPVRKKKLDRGDQ